MSLCNNCSIRSVCFVAMQNETIRSFASCSIDNCRYYTPMQRNFAEHISLDKRIDTLKQLRKDNVVKPVAEKHVCADCGLPSNECVRCDICGAWSCPECSVTTLDNRLLCAECYNYDDKSTFSYVTEV